MRVRRYVVITTFDIRLEQYKTVVASSIVCSKRSASSISPMAYEENESDSPLCTAHMLKRRREVRIRRYLEKITFDIGREQDKTVVVGKASFQMPVHKITVFEKKLSLGNFFLTTGIRTECRRYVRGIACHPFQGLNL